MKCCLEASSLLSNIEKKKKGKKKRKNGILKKTYNQKKMKCNKRIGSMVTQLYSSKINWSSRSSSDNKKDKQKCKGWKKLST